YVDDYVAALGHDFITTTVEATCEEAGSVTVTCSRCDYLDVTVIPALGHDFITTTVEATCEEAGSVTVTCSRCDYLDVTVIPALGHDFITTTVEATCEEAGSVTVTCSRCDYLDVTVIPALGHDYITTTVEATCEEAGSVTVTCSRCDYLDVTIIPALGHDWDDGVVTKEPTELEDGEKTFTCRRCGDTRTEIIPWIEKPKLIVNGIELTCEIIDGVVQINPTQEEMAAILNASGDTVVFDVRGSGCTDVDLLVAASWFNDSDKTIEIITDLGSVSIKTKTLWNNSGKMRKIVVSNNSLQFFNI
ncbi:MAG: hypothetical protein FWH55_12880, partial [Oscillospiraceae bacterium]|nr:hypothetical protein [Oscillospiraceae bacterium]